MRITRTILTSTSCSPTALPLSHQGRRAKGEPHGPERSRGVG